MYIRIYVLVLVYSMFRVRSPYMYMLESSMYIFMRSGACIQIGFSSDIYVYALANSNTQSLVISSPIIMD
jgi:hypothetical protein